MCIVTEEFMDILRKDVHVGYWQEELNIARQNNDQTNIERCDRILRKAFQERWVHRIGMDVYNGKVDVSMINPRNGMRVVDALMQRLQKDGWLQACPLPRLPTNRSPAV